MQFYANGIFFELVVKLTAPKIKNEVRIDNPSVRTVQHRLAKKSLYGQIACKKPYISKKNRIKHLKL